MNMNGYQEYNQLEQSVAHAGTQLHTMVYKLNEFERNLDRTTTNLEEIDDMCVLELLESVSEVRNEYQNLRKDLHEVQQMQRDVTASIRYQMRSMQSTYEMLKKRLELRASQN